MPTNPKDNEYPALDWQRFAARLITQRFIITVDMVHERVNLARYSLLPLCNMDKDAFLFILDALFARTLSVNRHLIWYSDSTQPDLGGNEEKDFRLYYQAELENPEIVQKGFYRRYCAEIDILMLEVNTIVQADFLKDLEDANMIFN